MENTRYQIAVQTPANKFGLRLYVTPTGEFADDHLLGAEYDTLLETRRAMEKLLEKMSKLKLSIIRRVILKSYDEDWEEV